ncbi:MAG: SpoIIE family protein phosphatase [Treponema sp.]|nr:SpoIIE family protein phosphatase [Treponema sp.]
MTKEAVLLQKPVYSAEPKGRRFPSRYSNEPANLKWSNESSLLDDNKTLKSWGHSPTVRVRNLVSKAAPPVKYYPNAIQRLAKHFWYVEHDKNIIELADELEQRLDVTVVCITNEKKQPIGIIRRDKLFLSLGKRFGRDIMLKNTTGDVAEFAEVYAGERNIFTVLGQLRQQGGENAGSLENKQGTQNEYIVLVDSLGIYSGMLSFQDVADHLVEMTNNDIAQASLLQERLLATTDEIKHFDVKVDTWCVSAKGVGGDFYFIRKIDNNRFFASLCDVSGKGVTASLVVSLVWGFLQSHEMQKGLKALLKKLNSLIVSSFHMEKYLTGFFLMYDAESRTLMVADMGHSHTVYLRKCKKVSMQKTRVNYPIGVELDMEPLVYSFHVEAGDALLIYSDGISEQDDPAGEEFGEKRVTALLQESLAKNIPFGEMLQKALKDFRMNTPQHDDMTFLLFQF